jgi:colicin import membrane protein
MAETVTTDPVNPPTSQDPPANPDVPDEKLGEPGLKALKAERDARAKAEQDLADARAALQQIEDAKLSDIQRAQKEAADAATTAASLRLENARLAALAEHPVPKDYQDLVTGTDAESFLASAKKVAALAAAASGKVAPLDRIPDSGDRSKNNSVTPGGSVAAGREMFASKKKISQKEG